MKAEEIIALMGKSVKHPEVQKVMAYYGLKKPRLSGYESVTAFSDKMGISIDFLPTESFETEYADSSITLKGNSADHDEPNMELLVECITFEKNFKEGLPYQLKFNESTEQLAELGKPHQKEKNGDGYNCFFLNGQHRILTSLAQDKTLRFLRIWPISNEIKKALKRKEMTARQSKNLKPEALPVFDSLNQQNPILLWKERRLAGDELFSDASLHASGLALDTFVDKIKTAMAERKANKIGTAIKEVVMAFNRLNEKYQHIDTLEREELCRFIDLVISTSGFELEEGEDVTEEWRHW